jgi:hypothetical protein
MSRTAEIEWAIRSELLQQGPCPLETLLERLQRFSWSEVFSVIDQLSREGRLVLRHPARFDYEVSLGLPRPTSDLTLDGVENRASAQTEQCFTL